MSYNIQGPDDEEVPFSPNKNNQNFQSYQPRTFPVSGFQTKIYSSAIPQGSYSPSASTPICDDNDEQNLREIEKALGLEDLLDGAEEDFVDQMEDLEKSGDTEAWFPACRSCTCCQGYKYGCKCISKGAKVCLTCSPVSSNTVSQPAAQVESNPNSDYWFPASRNCSCCQGYKYACNCVKKGFEVCQIQGCLPTPTIEESLPIEPQNGSNYYPSDLPPDYFSESQNCRCCTGYRLACNCVHNGYPECQYCAGGGGYYQQKRAPSNNVCQFFLSGNCKFGNHCRNSHEVPYDPSSGNYYYS